MGKVTDFNRGKFLGRELGMSCHQLTFPTKLENKFVNPVARGSLSISGIVLLFTIWNPPPNGIGPSRIRFSGFGGDVHGKRVVLRW